MATNKSEINAAKAPSEESTSERSISGYWNNVLLNIAVTGETKTGKSTFINAIRGLKDDDEGAAETGITETTTNPTPYEHPRMPRVVFWDLPGIGSKNFPAHSYLKDVKFDSYDFFIIISSGRFRENDIMLAKEIQKRKKLFYFIRSKIDNDIKAEAGKRNFNREETLSKIRRDCEENLSEIQNARIFLISSKDVFAYDFQQMVSTLKSDLPQLKQKALLQSVPVSSLAILEKKVKMFEKAVWAAALLSGGIMVVPVPFLSLACDAGILMTFFTSCYHAFGLDEKSLDRLAERVNKPHLKATSEIKSPVVSLLKVLALKTTASVCGLFLHSLMSEGKSVKAALSCIVTYKLLQIGLEKLTSAARAVQKTAEQRTDL